MEARKVIQFGNSSHVISIPKAWINENKLKKGDLIFVEKNGNGELILMPRERKEKIKEKEIVIDIKGKSINEIERETITAYIANFDVITFTGDDVKKITKNLKNIFQNLMALEIVEQTTKKIISKVFLNIKETSILHFIERMDVIIRSMISDSRNEFEKYYDDILQRDKEINKITYLIYRKVSYTLENLDSFKTTEPKSLNLLNVWRLTFNLEKVADETKRIAKFLRKLKSKKSILQEANDLYSEIEKHYLNTMKAYYAGDAKNALSIATHKDQLLSISKKFYEKNWKKHKEISNLVTNYKGMIVAIHEMGRVIYHL